jgi:hypothetical protein
MKSGKSSCCLQRVIKPLTWLVIDFASTVVMETSLCNGTLDFVTIEYKEFLNF